MEKVHWSSELHRCALYVCKRQYKCSRQDRSEKLIVIMRLLYHSISGAKKWTINKMFKILMVIVTLLTIAVIQQILMKNRGTTLDRAWNQYTSITWNRNGITAKWPRILVPQDLNPSNHLYNPRKILNNKNEILEKEIDSFIPATNVNRNYVMNIGYPGQQGAAVRAMTSFQCFLSSLNQGLTFLEPYVENTKIKGYSTKEDAVKFSDIFDFEHFNSASRKIGYTELVKMNEFVTHSPNYTILVLTKTKTERTQRVIWSSEWSGGRVRCLGESEIDSFSSTDREIIVQLQNVLKKIKNSDVCILRVIELSVSYHKKIKNGLKVFDFYDVKDFIFHKWSPKEVTLVFNYWSGPYFVPVSTVTRKMTCKRSYNTDKSKFQFKPSKRLILDAERYEERYLGRSNNLAMMIRVERVLEYLRETGKRKTLIQCFQEITEIRQKIQTDMNSSTVPLVTMDVGSYGSQTLNRSSYGDVISLSKEKLLGFYSRNSWTFEDWENSFIEAAGGVVNSGYIGALQRILASRADCLVLMGGGNYQALAVQDYMNYHHSGNDTCIHLVCSMTEKNTLVQKTIKNFKERESSLAI